jgi:hypothetical protein
MIIDERSCIRFGVFSLCVDWCLTMDHFRLTRPRTAKASTSPWSRTGRSIPNATRPSLHTCCEFCQPFFIEARNYGAPLLRLDDDIRSQDIF